MTVDRYTKSVLTVIALSLCALVLCRLHWVQALPWLQYASQVRRATEPHPVSYADFLTIVLTALGVMLAALAIFIGIAAVWGYGGIKEALTKEVRESAGRALAEKLKEYPAAQEMVDLKRRVDEVEQVKAQMMAAPQGASSAVQTSENVENGVEREAASFPAQDYPPQIGS